MSPRYGVALSFIAATVIVFGAAVLRSTVLPDDPVLAFAESLAAGVVATISLSVLGRDPF